MLDVKNAGLVSKPDRLDGELDGLCAQTPTMRQGLSGAAHVYSPEGARER